ncbi:hypothetical protein TL16_g01191 [Triparma laevis f. inornata]|uniref:Uncharacterized protein n=1 Tax=Triparma laevis f. inornata TaxID=1714386 RepID=A0A9W7DQB4_9STRA|nr:hypothetical protein TL16_g01191 [Triparma laevis f. inornata]
MRINRDGAKGGDNKASLDKGFEKVGRGKSTDGSDQFKSPDIGTQKEHWKQLVQYFDNFEEVRNGYCEERSYEITTITMTWQFIISSLRSSITTMTMAIIILSLVLATMSNL